MPKVRNSSVELLRILATICICLSHSVPFGLHINDAIRFDIELPVSTFAGICMIIFSYLGQIGNGIFIVCACFYATEQLTRHIVSKVLNIILDTFIISCAIYAIFLAGGVG